MSTTMADDRRTNRTYAITPHQNHQPQYSPLQLILRRYHCAKIGVIQYFISQSSNRNMESAGYKFRSLTKIIRLVSDIVARKGMENLTFYSPRPCPRKKPARNSPAPRKPKKNRVKRIRKMAPRARQNKKLFLALCTWNRNTNSCEYNFI